MLFYVLKLNQCLALSSLTRKPAVTELPAWPYPESPWAYSTNTCSTLFERRRMRSTLRITCHTRFSAHLAHPAAQARLPVTVRTDAPEKTRAVQHHMHAQKCGLNRHEPDSMCRRSTAPHTADSWRELVHKRYRRCAIHDRDILRIGKRLAGAHAKSHASSCVAKLKGRRPHGHRRCPFSRVHPSPRDACIATAVAAVFVNTM